MKLIRATIIIEGEVQKVGYRDLVQGVARGLGVKGYVENLKDGTVKVVCEAEEGILEKFIRMIDVKREFINVERVNLIETSKATGEFKYFEIRYGPLEEELGDRIGTAIKYAGAMWQDIKEMRIDMKNMHKDLKDETAAIRESIKEMHKDLKDETAAIRESIKEMHKDLKDETAAIRESIKEMHTDVNKSFEEMAGRYDSISAELIRTREELTRAVDRLSNLIDEFIRRGAKS